ncbi:MAG: DUF2815 family protein [Gammaproteobacteria bacterium]|jgi:hypothetical protein|nr:DUF2815 family protein [Gammaproteobacteria bacterium]
MASTLIKNARLSFPNLFKPAAFDANQEPRYGATFILQADDPQVAALRETIKQVVAEKWKKTPPGLKVFLRDGSEKAHVGGFGDGTVFFNAAAPADRRPGVYDRQGRPLVEADGKPYAGCYVNVRLDIWAQDNQYGKRVNASLSGVQFYRDGEAFGGGRPAQADEFPTYEEDEDDFLGNAA